MLKRLALGVIAALNIAAMTGCGQVGAPSAPMGVARAQAASQTVFAAGHVRKLGFDVGRYQRVQAPLAHPVQLPTQGILPAKVDLRAQCSPVLDQYELSSCTSFAVGNGLRESLMAKRGEARVALSPLFLYYETRKVRGNIEQDTGATITDAMKAIAIAGDAPEAAWPYDTMKFDQQPPAEAAKAAARYKLTTGVQLKGLEDMKKALAKGQPVVFGMVLFNTFQNIGPDGMLPMPQVGDVFVGGHAVEVVGYDNQKKVLIIKNSYGTEFGDHGYFYMPYAYVTPENVMDIWTAK
jgi:C1A family cysteine protease